MTNDSLMRQIANGDAYAPEFDLPDAARPADVAFADISRRIDMDAKELTRSVEKDPRNRRAGWYAAAAAFGLVVVLVGSVVLLNRSSDPEIPPATTPPTTQAATTTTEAPTTTTPADETVSAQELAVIASYQDAVNSGDPEQIASMLGAGFRHTDQATVADGYFGVADNWIHQQLSISLQGAMVSYTECVPSGDKVLCLETWSGPITKAVLGADWTARMEFLLGDGIVEALHSRTLVWPDFPATHLVYESMIEWASEQADAETAALLAGCALGDQADLEAAPLCGQWFLSWTEAGRP